MKIEYDKKNYPLNYLQFLKQHTIFSPTGSVVGKKKAGRESVNLGGGTSYTCNQRRGGVSEKKLNL